MFARRLLYKPLPSPTSSVTHTLAKPPEHSLTPPTHSQQFMLIPDPLSYPCAYLYSGFSIEDFFTTKLRRRRPVLINVRGGDVCSLLAQLTLPPAPENSDSKDSDPDILLRLDDEPLKPVGTTPLALLTSGWDGNGSPFGGSSHDWDRCAHKILDLPQVAIWFVSHQRGNQILPKVRGLIWCVWRLRDDVSSSVDGCISFSTQCKSGTLRLALLAGMMDNA